MRHEAYTFSLYRRANKEEIAFFNKISLNPTKAGEVHKIKRTKIYFRTVTKNVLYVDQP